MSRLYFTFCVLVGFGLPSLVFIIGKIPIPATFLAILCVTWLAIPFGKQGWFSWVALCLGIVTNVFGALVQVPPLIPVISTIFILSAWDLGRFQSFLSLAGEGDNTNEAEHHHIKNIFLFQLISILVSLGTTIIRIEIGFIQAILLLMIVFIGFLQLVRWLVRDDQQSPE